jgi:hypothetical protein
VATIDTLASLHSVPRTNLLVLIIEGLAPGVEYWIGAHTQDTTSLIFCDVSEQDEPAYVYDVDKVAYWGGGPHEADANGRIIKFFQNLVADASMNTDAGLPTDGLTLHEYDLGTNSNEKMYPQACDLPVTPNRRISNGFLFSTTNPLEALDPWYVEVDNLVATPGDGTVSLDWDPGTKLDAGRGSIEYTVLRDTTGSPGVGDELVEGLTGTSYVDNAVVNGTSYYYRIHARLYWDGFLPYTSDGYLPAAWAYSIFGDLDMSNIYEAIPDAESVTGEIDMSAVRFRVEN